MEPLLVNTSTARDMLGKIGKTKLFELLRDGKLDRRKCGSKTLVTLKSIEAFAEKGDE
jgi:hypothetical protein